MTVQLETDPVGVIRTAEIAYRCDDLDRADEALTKALGIVRKLQNQQDSDDDDGWTEDTTEPKMAIVGAEIACRESKYKTADGALKQARELVSAERSPQAEVAHDD